MKEEVKQANKKDNFRFLFEHAPDGVVMIDQYNFIRFWNPKAETIFGWTSEEVLEKSLSEVIVPPQFREAHDNGMKRYLATGEVRVLNKTIEVPAINRSGKEFYISLTISKIDRVDGTSFWLSFGISQSSETTRRSYSKKPSNWNAPTPN